MSTNYKESKALKKQRRCEAIISNECKIESSKTPTTYLAVLNAGLSTGLTEELLLNSASCYGTVRQLIMLPNKSYCFLECSTTNDAESIRNGMHNSACIGQKGAIVFLSYFNQLPALIENIWEKPLPKGLLLVPDFISNAEEEILIQAVRVKNENVISNDLKHRMVRHFGYEFIYGINNVDVNCPMEEKIPTVCSTLWPRIQNVVKENNLITDWQIPDQLTVNEYEPGQGIPVHVDTHSAFLDPILSLSLMGDVVMEFRKSKERRLVVLPRRSLLVMSGESRYDWLHGITPRMMDVVPTSSGTLTSKVRTKRISLTFRRLRRSACQCSFPVLCDSRIQETKKIAESFTIDATRLEEINVHNVYDEIANHFSETRHKPWPRVVDFLNSFECGSVLLDVGCGNGKYLECNRNTLNIGCDRSQGLLNVSANMPYRSVFRCDCLQVPLRSQSIDGCISIAVIHHLATRERRISSIREMARLLRSGGRALIYVWAKDQHSGSQKSSYLRQNNAINKNKTTEEQQRQETEKNLHTEAQNAAVNLPIHTNRTNFLQQDVLVPWKLKGAMAAADDLKTTFLRYYHVFEHDELRLMVDEVPEINVLDSYYDQGNHCIIFERK